MPDETCGFIIDKQNNTPCGEIATRHYRERRSGVLFFVCQKHYDVWDREDAKFRAAQRGEEIPSE